MRNFIFLGALGLLTVVLHSVPNTVPHTVPNAGPQAAAQQVDPAKLPQDAHQNFMVAADSYADAARSKEKFGKGADPYPVGLLAVDVYFRNDTKLPIHVDLSTIRLDVDDPNGQKFHLAALSLARAANDIAHPKGPSTPTARRLPIPIPLPGGDSKQQEVMDKLQPFTLQSDIVPPGRTIHGCVFFDMNHRFDLARYASLYVPDVKSVGSDAAMIYFEVALGSKRAK